ncbi:MAG: RNA methyltransferase [Candidatus Thorarchaeota archaeon]|nr:MAG: RNA methyltransferase [Candidatus Thorarchaeota archaeon]
MRLYIGLVHYPVYNKKNEIIASAITTLDLHDIARLARTYDLKKFFVITPLDDQQELAGRVIKHWTRGYGSRYNRDRKEAIKLVAVVPSLERAVDDVIQAEGDAPLLIATDASRQEDRSISFERARAVIRQELPVFLLFGTAWGLDKAFMTMADHVLEPISGRSEYNHLSVRTAAAIILDRLVGRY